MKSKKELIALLKAELNNLEELEKLFDDNEKRKNQYIGEQLALHHVIMMLEDNAFYKSMVNLYLS